jgi:hypothetical protein
MARAVRAHRAGVLATSALACAALISACGSSSSSTTNAGPSKPVDTALVARSIKDTIFTKRHLFATTVTCPTTVASEPGKTFQCTATVRSAKTPYTYSKTPFTVTVQNNKGYVTYVGE